MNKEKIVEELNKWAAEELGMQYKCVSDTGDLSLALYRNAKLYRYVTWFKDFRSDKFYFDGGGLDSKINIQLTEDDVIRKFYNKGVELLSKNEPRYTIQIIENNEYSYLNINRKNRNIIFDDRQYPEQYKTEFTQLEIEVLKNRDDLAIDWDKAVIKEVND
ncbi:hypothetical protein [Ligilactobacillus cholophilus]|uniref:hypothetical protein n=1 Tax=Ligilactobacillus cholophilus TaxID=3050131 RepID=UPI0025AFC5AD|nr:hypothetical protein [Ligilactobacillus cholophilus]